MSEVQHAVFDPSQKRTQGLRPGLHSLRRVTGAGGLLHFYRLFQLEAEGGFGGQDNVLVAGKSCAARAGATAGQRTDRSALAAAGQAANQGSQARAAAGQDGRALAFPVAVRDTEDVEMDCSEPPMVIEVKRNCREAPPLKRPSGLASTTVPEAAAPAGIAVLPSTETGLARVAVKVWPGELILEPTACPSRTVNTVPAGTTKALDASGFMFDIAVLDIAEPEPLPEEGFAIFPPDAAEPLLSLEAPVEEFESAGAAGLLQPSRAKDK